MTDILPYSYHTFLCPFVYDEKNNFIKELLKNKNENKKDDLWKKEPSFKRDVGPLGEGDIGDENLLRYAEYHYFMPAAQELLFNIENKDEEKKEDNSVLFYRKDLKRWTEPYEFMIKDDYNRHLSNLIYTDLSSHLCIWLNENVYYKLCIDSIRLALCPQMHIGILSLELENYVYNSLEDIIKINEFGRRVYSPTIMRNKKDTSKFDGLPSLVPSKTDIKIDYPVTIKQNEAQEPNSFRRTQELIENILYGKKDANEIENKFLGIDPAIDDRMFVVSLVRKNGFKPIDKKSTIDGSYPYLKQGSKEAKDLYRLIFIESGDPSCQNSIMLQDKLKEHVYPRWTDYGTVHGVTEYSLVCLTGEADYLENSVINPFLTEYVDMVKLALLQRTAIINLEHQASKISEEIKISDEDDNLNDLVKNSQELWKKYIKFQNEFYMPEVTFQEQGVEIYDILKKSLRLEELNRYLEDELNDFHALTEMQDSNRREEAINQREVLNTAINLIAVVGTTVAIVSMAQDYINDLLGKFNILTFGVGFFVVLLINIFTIFVLNTFREKRKGKMWGILCVVWMLLLIIVYFMMEPSIKWSKSSVSANNCEYVSEQE